jgi:hypothetical protein
MQAAHRRMVRAWAAHQCIRRVPAHVSLARSADGLPAVLAPAPAPADQGPGVPTSNQLLVASYSSNVFRGRSHRRNPSASHLHFRFVPRFPAPLCILHPDLNRWRNEPSPSGTSHQERGHFGAARSCPETLPMNRKPKNKNGRLKAASRWWNIESTEPYATPRSVTICRIRSSARCKFSSEFAYDSRR